MLEFLIAVCWLCFLPALLQRVALLESILDHSTGIGIYPARLHGNRFLMR